MRASRIAQRTKNLGNDIGRDLVFDEGDAVAQLQFALLQPLQPQQIRRRRLVQSIDRGVEIAMLLLQPCELVLKFPLIFVGHGVRRLKTRMRLREVIENIVPAGPLRKRPRLPEPGKVWDGSEPDTGSRFHSHDWLQITPKYEGREFR